MTAPEPPDSHTALLAAEAAWKSSQRHKARTLLRTKGPIDSRDVPDALFEEVLLMCSKGEARYFDKWTKKGRRGSKVNAIFFEMVVS